MSASSPALFDDDCAADVRDLFKERIATGVSSTKARKELMRDFEIESKANPEYTVFWLALAATEWQLGCLEPIVLRTALRIIDSGSDLPRWGDVTNLRQRRQKVLETLRRQLVRPNVKPSMVRPRTPRCTSWTRGSVFTYKLREGCLVLLRVIAVCKNGVDDFPVCELLDWVGQEMPSVAEVRQLKIRRNWRYASESAFSFPLVKRYLSRCFTLPEQFEPELPEHVDHLLPIDFDDIENGLSENFRLHLVSATRSSPALLSKPN